jgi:hypothetical protein
MSSIGDNFLKEEFDQESEEDEASGSEEDNQSTVTAGKDNPGGASGGGANAKAKAKGKAKAKAKVGMKYCNGCAKHLPAASFPQGKALCIDDNNAHRNLKALAESTGEGAWWAEVSRDTDKLRHALKAYRDKTVPVAGANKRARRNFSITSYREEARKFSAVYFDGIYEMMTLKQYSVWVSLPENGGKDSEDAKVAWLDFQKEAGAICDNKGPCAKFRQRVAIKVKDVVKFRDGHERSQIATAAEKESKKATQKELDELEVRMRQGAATSMEDRSDLAQRMVTSAGAAGSAGGGGAFSEVGVGVSNFGSIHDLKDDMKELEEQANEEEAEDKEKEKETEGETPKAKAKAKSKAEKVWFQRDEKILAEISRHRTWETTVKGNLGEVKRRLEQVAEKATIDIKDEVVAEMRLLSNRLRAVKLVLMEPGGQKPSDDDEVGEKDSMNNVDGTPSKVGDQEDDKKNAEMKEDEKEEAESNKAGTDAKAKTAEGGQGETTLPKEALVPPAPSFAGCEAGRAH